MYINKIYKLFRDNNYIIKIGSKIDINDIKQKIIFINPINISEQYIINILDINNIYVIIPLKNTNFNFKTKISFNNLYNYIENHLIK